MSEDRSGASAAPPSAEERNVHAAVEIAIRLGILLLLVGWCLSILAPFAGIVVWALIIAIACEDLFRRLVAFLAGRRGAAAAIFLVVTLTLLIVPSVLLSETLVFGAQRFASNLQSGGITIPSPPERIAGWPLVGDQIYDLWLLASENIEDALERLQPQLEAVSRWLLRAAGSAGVALLQLTASLFLAGFFLTRSEGRRAAVTRFANRLARDRGAEFARLTEATVKSVVQGILGVAVIQATLAGLAFMAVGLPAAGLWALLVLVAAVVQLPVALTLIVPSIIVFSSASTAVFAAFAAWCLMVSLIDNILKPILFGRGVEVPTIVIFLGAIGGMLTMGIIGLFLGAVVLALGYELFVTWIGEADAVEPEAGAP